MSERNEIYADIMKRGWNADVGRVHPALRDPDPRCLAAAHAAMIYRYNPSASPDGRPGQEVYLPTLIWSSGRDTSGRLCQTLG
jgi:hypothetical protein